MTGFDDLNMENPLWLTYLFYAGVLGLKLVIMSPMTARHRMAKQTFANPEDTKLTDKAKVKFDDPDIERVRRAHLNDLENIVPFLLLCPLWISTGPSSWLATNLIRVFAGARILHTIVYVNEVPQPSRALAFLVGFLINVYMSFQLIVAAM